MRITKNAAFAILLVQFIVSGWAQSSRPSPPPIASTADPKAFACKGKAIPQLQDITAKAGIQFRHVSDPEKKYIVESMSGGVLLIDYDRDGWLDIYFTNSPTVDMAIKGQKSRSVLY